MRIAGLTFALGIGAFVAVVSAGCGSRTPLLDEGATYGDGGFDGNEPEGAPPNSCGNGKCDNGETCMTCALDCGVCSTCGDGSCEMSNGETCYNCPRDCGVCPTCGDGKCQMPAENCQNCDVDCGVCPGCGDGSCDPGPPQNENCYTCEKDCGKCPGCGDGLCNGNETCASCPQDCGVCAVCGNGKCEAPYETCVNCVADCGQCPTIDCSQELQCALKCFNIMQQPPMISLTCVGDCTAEGCPSAGYLVDQAVNCFIQQLFPGGMCQGMLNINCLLQACMGPVAACIGQRCPPGQVQDGG